MRRADFDYQLPSQLIAQQPTPQRDASRLLVLHRDTHVLDHRCFRDLHSYLNPGDLLVFNDSRVIQARLRGKNSHTIGRFEILLLSENARNDWWVMLRPGKRAPIGTRILLTEGRDAYCGIDALVIDINTEGHRRVTFSGTEEILHDLGRIGELPLPPYIQRTRALASDLDRYQTVYNRSAGSIAAPTAGLHFTEPALADLRKQGIATCFVTLHVGAGTFAPVKTESLQAHVMHEEHFEITAEAADAVAQAKSRNGRVVAVGTTSVRVLETAAARSGRVQPMKGRTNIFIYPPYNFHVVDALLTNFHLPGSTLLMLASAFAAPGSTEGRDFLLSAYRKAIEERYRFFSYGDAMLLR